MSYIDYINNTSADTLKYLTEAQLLAQLQPLTADQRADFIIRKNCRIISGTNTTADGIDTYVTNFFKDQTVDVITSFPDVPDRKLRVDSTKAILQKIKANPYNAYISPSNNSKIDLALAQLNEVPRNFYVTDIKLMSQP